MLVVNPDVAVICLNISHMDCLYGALKALVIILTESIPINFNYMKKSYLL